MKRFVLAGCAWIVVFVALLVPVTSARAQSTSSAALNTPPPASETSVPGHDSEKDEYAPMHWAGIGVRAGIMGIGTAKLTVSGTSSRIDARTGPYASLPIWMGADGIGWLIEPYYFGSSVTREIIDDETEVVVAKENVDLHAVGCGGGPTLIFQTRIKKLFIGTGLHGRWGWLINDAYDAAFDVYGRLPINATYYVHKQVAVTFEGAFGYGGSAFVNKPVTRTLTAEEIAKIREETGEPPDPSKVLEVDTEFKFGLAPTWDFNIGVRFP